ncbi:DUF4034 domain-containing protein [Pseudomarimonas arenosa]|uniref:DUF4034 domain-containing protein n=1 Tax=Pseudomarimonas arenosa TaxID=2774145 RepID=A0AAW3ZQQ0_9GAMM|nr:DUF4034 domain-containing protein [Pseudomarimonas arenosa]MBD8527245.1 DUF4034 domain-containing protein [Pseudomarimonas arenosa]
MKRLLVGVLLLLAAALGVFAYGVYGLQLGTSKAVWRCFLAPNPPGVKWSMELVALQCRDFNDPVISEREIWNSVDGRVDELEARFAALTDQLSAGQISDVSYARAFHAFEYGSDEVRGLVNHWREQRPESAYALTAQGIHLSQKAFEARGIALARDVSEEQWQSMREFGGQAAELLRRAVVIEPRLLPAWNQQIVLGRIGVREASEEEALAGALAQFPDAYTPRSVYLFGLQPRWGGSVEAMRGFVARSIDEAGTNPRMALLQAQALAFEQWTNTNWKDLAEVSRRSQARLVEAPNLDEIFDLSDEQDGKADIELALHYANAGLRFRPAHYAFLRNKARALTSLNRPQEALAVIEEMLELNQTNGQSLWMGAYAARKANNHALAETYYLRAANHVDDKEGLRRDLAGYYLYHLQRYQDAKREVAALLAINPESADGWLMQADVIVNLGLEGREEAAGRFLRFADRSNPKHASVIPSVVAWINEQRAKRGEPPLAAHSGDADSTADQTQD